MPGVKTGPVTAQVTSVPVLVYDAINMLLVQRPFKEHLHEGNVEMDLLAAVVMVESDTHPQSPPILLWKPGAGVQPAIIQSPHSGDSSVENFNNSLHFCALSFLVQIEEETLPG